MFFAISFVELPQGLRENGFWSEAPSSGSVIIMGEFYPGQTIYSTYRTALSLL